MWEQTEQESRFDKQHGKSITTRRRHKAKVHNDSL